MRTYDDRQSPMKEKLSALLSDFSLVVVVALAILIGYWQYSSEPKPEIPPIDPEKEVPGFHTAIFANCRNVDFKSLEDLAKGFDFDHSTAYASYDFAIVNHQSGRFEEDIEDQLTEAKLYFQESLNDQAAGFFTSEEKAKTLNGIDINKVLFINAEEKTYQALTEHYFSYTIKQCRYEDVTDIQKENRFAFPSDLAFLIQSKDLLETPDISISEISLGSTIGGSGTVISIDRCQQDGHIFAECSQIGVLNGDGITIVLTPKMSVTELAKLSIGDLASFDHCILTEINQSRGIAGYQFADYFNELSKTTQDSIAIGIEAAETEAADDINSSLTTLGISSLGHVIKNIKVMPDYIPSITCETTKDNVAFLTPPPVDTTSDKDETAQ